MFPRRTAASLGKTREKAQTSSEKERERDEERKREKERNKARAMREREREREQRSLAEGDRDRRNYENVVQQSIPFSYSPPGPDRMLVSIRRQVFRFVCAPRRWKFGR